jgi:hypothetical protein
MRLATVICRLAVPVGVLLYGLGGASAQGVDVRQACTPDAMRLCSEFIPDVAKITACMTAKRAQLSQLCRTAMVASRPAPRRRVVRYYRVRHVSRHR